MRGALAVVGALALAFVLAAVPKAVRDTRPYTYNLWVLHDGQMAVICTGTVIRGDEGPLFLSAGHCVADWPNARFFISKDPDPDVLIRVRLKWWEFEGIDNWNEGDFSVFTLPKDFPSDGLKVCREPPEPGEDVWMWTGPLGMLPMLRAGIYSGELHFPDSPEDEEALGGMMFAHIEGAPGSSGSGVLRLEDGEPCVFGVLVGAFTRGPDGSILSSIPPVLR